MKNSDIIKFNKMFAKGNQNIELMPSGFISSKCVTFNWQSSENFNIFPLIIEYIKRSYPKIPDSQLYGKDKIVDRLVPYQKQLNEVKNRKIEVMDRLAYQNMTVEDGSIDIDSLESDGLGPGRILIYRNGAEKPSLINSETDVQLYSILSSEEANIKTIIKDIVEMTLCDFGFSPISKSWRSNDE